VDATANGKKSHTMSTTPVKTSPIAPNGNFAVPPIIEEIVELKSARSLDERALRTIFERALEIALLGPTSANSLPLRVVFVETPEAKERLRPAMAPNNLDKTMAAPVTAIIAADLKFYDQFPRTFPERGEMFKGLSGGQSAEAQRGVAWDNALLQTQWRASRKRGRTAHGISAMQGSGS
jgi:nitroreductase